MEKMPEKKRFSLIARLKSTNHALRGLAIFWKTTHNAWVHVFFSILAIYLGFVVHLSTVEWILIIFVIALVLLFEMINTAIEIDINLTSPNYHPYARDTKDVAAAAVSVAAILAGIVGILIFIPKLYLMVK